MAFRYLDKTNNSNERALISDWWAEQIEIYGQLVMFYSLNLSAMSASFDPIYGEKGAPSYRSPSAVLAIVEKSQDSALLGKFGIVADGDISGFIHPDHFQPLFGVSSEPKVGDVIRLEEYGLDHINYPRYQGEWYELTDVTDEYEQVINAIAGHYVWHFKAKKYDGPLANVSSGPPPKDDGDLIEQLTLDFDEITPCSPSNVYGEF